MVNGADSQWAHRGSQSCMINHLSAHRLYVSLSVSRNAALSRSTLVGVVGESQETDATFKGFVVDWVVDAGPSWTFPLSKKLIRKSSEILNICEPTSDLMVIESYKGQKILYKKQLLTKQLAKNSFSNCDCWRYLHAHYVFCTFTKYIRFFSSFLRFK